MLFSGRPVFRWGVSPGLPFSKSWISVASIPAMPRPPLRLRPLPPPSGRLLAGGCAALVVLLVVFAASPALHEWLHPDADHADHECAITLFMHGVDAGGAAVVAAATVWRVVASARCIPPGPDLDRRSRWLPPGNAPPALS